MNLTAICRFFVVKNKVPGLHKCLKCGKNFVYPHIINEASILIPPQDIFVVFKTLIMI